MKRAVALLAVACFLGAAPVFAQEKAVDVHIGGGYTFVLGEVRDHIGDGYNVSFGATVNLTEQIGIEAEYSFNGLDRKTIPIDVSPSPGVGSTSAELYGEMNMQYGDINLVLRPTTSEMTKPYVVFGGGIYHRPIKVTTPSTGYVPGYCDPWWYVCYPGGWVPVERIVGERSSTDFGIDFGAGVDLKLAENIRVYVEARYHYIWGPEVSTSGGGTATKKANGQFLPITIGLRF